MERAINSSVYAPTTGPPEAEFFKNWVWQVCGGSSEASCFKRWTSQLRTKKDRNSLGHWMRKVGRALLCIVYECRPEGEALAREILERTAQSRRRHCIRGPFHSASEHRRASPNNVRARSEGPRTLPAGPSRPDLRGQPPRARPNGRSYVRIGTAMQRNELSSSSACWCQPAGSASLHPGAAMDSVTTGLMSFAATCSTSPAIVTRWRHRR